LGAVEPAVRAAGLRRALDLAGRPPALLATAAGSGAGSGATGAGSTGATPATPTVLDSVRWQLSQVMIVRTSVPS